MNYPSEFDEYEKFVWRMNSPRVVVDNASCEGATLFKVDSSNRHCILLDVVQILTDQDLEIKKAYISSDGGWFMDVFYVTDSSGNKVTNEETLNLIEKQITKCHEYPRRSFGSVQPTVLPSSSRYTAIELTGRDRPGLMSEISALLAGLRINIIAAELWTHNLRVACLLHVTEEATGGPIEDADILAKIKDSLSNLLRGDRDSKRVRTDFATSVTHTERRLHQLMFADRDYERETDDGGGDDFDWDSNEKITVHDCDEKGYSVVNIECRNRPKLVFDTLCTLTDMEYVVFHATIDSDGERAYQEYYIRHMDGCILSSDAERRKLIQCLRAAIERRVSEGLRLELCTIDRVGFLMDVTRIFREHGLSVTRADISVKTADASTNGCNATTIFYLTDAAGNTSVDNKVIESVKREIGAAVRQVTEVHTCPGERQLRSKFSLGNIFGVSSQVLLNLGLIKSYS